MPTLDEWRIYYDGWSGRDPALASTGHVVRDAEFRGLGAELATLLALQGDENVLDVGCASGTLTSQWAHRAGRVVGVDFSVPLVVEAGKRHGADRRGFAAAEAARLPFADATFDAVVCFNVLLSLPDAEYAARAIGEILRVARPGARVVLGSLPDRSKEEAFFANLAAAAPWHRRLGSKLKHVLVPQRARRRSTKILWFDIERLVEELERANCAVAVVDDPCFANYHVYRKTVVAVTPLRVEVCA